MTDVLIRDVPAGVVSALDKKAQKLGLSRTEYLRRQMLHMVAGSEVPVTLDDLRQSSEAFGDLDDPEVMRGAWE